MREIRTALVTGASGFVGRHLCTSLRARGISVRAQTRTPTSGPWNESLVADLAVPVDFGAALANVDAVFHLAGLAHAALPESRAAAAAYDALNIKATRQLVHASMGAKVERFVFLSSAKAIGEGQEQAYDDESQARPTTEYGRSKLAAEDIVLEASERHGFHAAIVRSVLMYGPGMKGNLRSMLDTIAAGRFPSLPETNNRRSLVDVRDTAAALLLAATDAGARGRKFIVSDGQAYSARRIFEALARAAGKTPGRACPLWILQATARLGDIGQRLVSSQLPYNGEKHEKLFGSAEYLNTGIVSALGFSPEYTLEGALPDLARYTVSESQ